ncbi:hypothetical protein PFICI_11544 [Pestalotiopsis fici W106-1]|uniref:Uncharacterized protein n=1 Tax=Pestalotiopsis fici (strain W106-1 / CGMCC3.15140) TaxID=1229662 RepID=W3WSM2_PESFW|nr:uncharacterized protein PFICI_11544 [Pestalotiopsis fici W106-1]ETS76157.1 hypothetical protein PFICI_11544 [Pestalotiopsis fici W106-1]
MAFVYPQDDDDTDPVLKLLDLHCPDPKGDKNKSRGDEHGNGQGGPADLGSSRPPVGYHRPCVLPISPWPHQRIDLITPYYGRSVDSNNLSSLGPMSTYPGFSDGHKTHTSFSLQETPLHDAPYDEPINDPSQYGNFPWISWIAKQPHSPSLLEAYQAYHQPKGLRPFPRADPANDQSRRTSGQEGSSDDCQIRHVSGRQRRRKKRLADGMTKENPILIEDDLTIGLAIEPIDSRASSCTLDFEHGPPRPPVNNLSDRASFVASPFTKSPGPPRVELLPLGSMPRPPRFGSSTGSVRQTIEEIEHYIRQDEMHRRYLKHTLEDITREVMEMQSYLGERNH